MCASVTMHSPRRNSVPDASSPITASPSAESAPVPEPTSEEPTRRPFRHQRSESLPTNKVQAHRYLFFDKIATDNIQAIVEKCLQANPAAPTLVPMPASQCSSGASSTEATSQLPLTDDHAASEWASTLVEHSAIALPLTDDEAGQMDSSATRKRAREQLGSDDEEDSPRKQPVTYPAVPELSNMGGDPSLRLEQTETGGADPVDLGEGAKGQKAKGTHKPVAQRPPLHAAAIDAILAYTKSTATGKGWECSEKLLVPSMGTKLAELRAEEKKNVVLQ
ncbi:uncharacterized protein LOC119167955 [Rhipicephalus microplus]|uniref:uncharacterized protein LOC119167955 n=1 Tax=Rhipicephalus microplus TaxID=6941 RepID=UPI003F6C21C0